MNDVLSRTITLIEGEATVRLPAAAQPHPSRKEAQEAMRAVEASRVADDVIARLASPTPSNNRGRAASRSPPAMPPPQPAMQDTSLGPPRLRGVGRSPPTPPVRASDNPRPTTALLVTRKDPPSKPSEDPRSVQLPPVGRPSQRK